MSDQERVDECADYAVYWECDPPLLGVPFRVTDDSWNADYTVRVIRRWEAAEETP